MNRRKIIAALAVAAVLSGAGTVAAQTASQTGAPAGQAGDAAAVPTIPSSTEQTHNPLKNPSAAGTQMPWKGYGATSGATSAHPIGSDNTGTHYGLDDGGSVTPGGGRELYAASASPPAGRAATPGEARERLKQLGYSRIAQLHQIGRSEWKAVARKNERRVRVTLGADGTIHGER